MILYHLERSKYQNVWPPEGSLHTEGRWNRAGQWVIYCSPTVSLAKLETLANSTNLPLSRVCMTIEVDEPVGIFEVPLTELPTIWMEKPYPNRIRAYTDAFLSSKNLIMQVPSAQSPRETNFLINVRHPDFFRQVRLLRVDTELFDARLKP